MEEVTQHHEKFISDLEDILSNRSNVPTLRFIALNTAFEQIKKKDKYVRYVYSDDMFPTPSNIDRQIRKFKKIENQELGKLLTEENIVTFREVLGERKKEHKVNDDTKLDEVCENGNFDLALTFLKSSDYGEELFFKAALKTLFVGAFKFGEGEILQLVCNYFPKEEHADLLDYEKLDQPKLHEHFAQYVQGDDLEKLVATFCSIFGIAAFCLFLQKTRGPYIWSTTGNHLKYALQYRNENLLTHCYKSGAYDTFFDANGAFNKAISFSIEKACINDKMIKIILGYLTIEDILHTFEDYARYPIIRFFWDFVDDEHHDWTIEYENYSQFESAMRLLDPKTILFILEKASDEQVKAMFEAHLYGNVNNKNVSKLADCDIVDIQAVVEKVEDKKRFQIICSLLDALKDNQSNESLEKISYLYGLLPYNLIGLSSAEIRGFQNSISWSSFFFAYYYHCCPSVLRSTSKLQRTQKQLALIYNVSDKEALSRIPEECIQRVLIDDHFMGLEQKSIDLYKLISPEAACQALNLGLEAMEDRHFPNVRRLVLTFLESYICKLPTKMFTNLILKMLLLCDYEGFTSVRIIRAIKDEESLDGTWEDKLDLLEKLWKKRSDTNKGELLVEVLALRNKYNEQIDLTMLVTRMLEETLGFCISRNDGLNSVNRKKTLSRLSQSRCHIIELITSNQPELYQPIDDLLKYVFVELPGQGNDKQQESGIAKQDKILEVLSEVLKTPEEQRISKLLELTESLLQNREAGNAVLKNRGTGGYFWNSFFRTHDKNPMDNRWSRSSTESRLIRLHNALKEHQADANEEHGVLQMENL